MSFLNLGIVAHVDAGKTSLTERLLFSTGVIDTIGSVDAGSTQTDTLELERQRGITIKAAVVSFAVDDVTVNLIDTPGHPDFIAEVERVLSVLDGAVLVVSAVEGVQARTRVLMRALRRLRIPTLIFVNKIDRMGAQEGPLLRSISEKLTPAIIPMGTTSALGTRAAQYQPFGAGEDFTARLVDVLATNDEALLARYVADETAVSHCQLLDALARQTRRALVHPVFFGSAITGAGVDALIAGVKELLPCAADDTAGPVSGAVFKIERGPSGEKIAYVRMFSGTIRARDRLQLGPDKEGKVTALNVFERGSAVQRPAVSAGQIGKLWGLARVQVGDAIGVPRGTAVCSFDPPTLETAVVPRRAGHLGALYWALSQLAEQDPLINLRQDDIRQELFLSLYGEVQKEVIEETLVRDFGLEVEFRETTPICVERPAGTGEAVELLGAPGNPFLATLGLRIEPAPPGTGVELRLAARVDTLPLYIYKSVEEFHRIMEETVRSTLQQGLSGWQVEDCLVTLTQSGYMSPSSSAREFRLLTPLVLMAALQEAGTIVCEPVHRFRLELPAECLGRAAHVLAQLGAVPDVTLVQGAGGVLEGEIPAARVHELQQLLPGLSRGEGVLEYAFARHVPVRGPLPTRFRTDYNPLNRKEYLVAVGRRT